MERDSKGRFLKGHPNLVPKESRRRQGEKMKIWNPSAFKKGQTNGKKNYNWVSISKKILVRLYVEGKKSIQEISKELNRDAGTISRKLKLYKIPIRTDSESLKIKFEDDEYKKRIIKASLKGLFKRPTSYEQKISDLCIKNNLSFVYTGNGTFLIGHKNPDFINEKKKIAIEVYHNYFKIRDFGSCENYEKQRSEYFAKYGWDVIFIRTEEITPKNWEGICLNKISKSLLSPNNRESLKIKKL